LDYLLKWNLQAPQDHQVYQLIGKLHNLLKRGLG
jgi:hypothetical protein